MYSHILVPAAHTKIDIQVTERKLVPCFLRCWALENMVNQWNQCCAKSRIKRRMLCARHSCENWTWDARRRSSMFSPTTRPQFNDVTSNRSGLNQSCLATPSQSRITRSKPHRCQFHAWTIPYYTQGFRSCKCYLYKTISLIVKEPMLQHRGLVSGLSREASLHTIYRYATQEAEPKGCCGNSSK
jgi:hypothetical protein